MCDYLLKSMILKHFGGAGFTDAPPLNLSTSRFAALTPSLFISIPVGCVGTNLQVCPVLRTGLKTCPYIFIFILLGSVSFATLTASFAPPIQTTSTKKYKATNLRVLEQLSDNLSKPLMGAQGAVLLSRELLNKNPEIKSLFR